MVKMLGDLPDVDVAKNVSRPAAAWRGGLGTAVGACQALPLCLSVGAPGGQAAGLPGGPQGSAAPTARASQLQQAGVAASAVAPRRALFLAWRRKRREVTPAGRPAGRSGSGLGAPQASTAPGRSKPYGTGARAWCLAAAERAELERARGQGGADCTWSEPLAACCTPFHSAGDCAHHHRPRPVRRHQHHRLQVRARHGQDHWW